MHSRCAKICNTNDSCVQHRRPFHTYVRKCYALILYCLSIIPEESWLKKPPTITAKHTHCTEEARVVSRIARLWWETSHLQLFFPHHLEQQWKKKKCYWNDSVTSLWVTSRNHWKFSGFTIVPREVWHHLWVCPRSDVMPLPMLPPVVPH